MSDAVEEATKDRDALKNQNDALTGIDLHPDDTLTVVCFPVPSWSMLTLHLLCTRPMRHPAPHACEYPAVAALLPPLSDPLAAQVHEVTSSLAGQGSAEDAVAQIGQLKVYSPRLKVCPRGLP